VSDARRTLLGGLIDFAGLFPPASLDVGGAVAGFRAARAHPHGWLVDRFVAPAEKVEAVGEAAAAGDGDPAAGTFAGDGAGAAPWPVALVTDAIALRAAGEAAGRVATALRVDVVELRPLPAAEVAGAVEAARIVFPGAAVFAEIAAGPELEQALDALAACGGGAKLRCGGQRVPPAEEVAAVLGGCAGRGVRLKATAGLHHPVAAEGRHGFLNLLAAAALGGDLDAVRDTDPSAFALDAGGFAWRGQALDPRLARERFAGLGSCSFDEPAEDLVAIGMLAPAGAVAG
jgi:hypothetical protein